MTTARLAFIGAGGIAHRHVDVLRHFPDVTIVAIADPVVARADELACSVGARAYDDFHRMIARESPDALYICVPPFAHGEPESAALDAGLPFFVEKPLAATYEIAASIAERVRQAGLLTAVGYHWRYLDTVERAQQLLATTPARLALGYWLDSRPSVPWWSCEAQSGGQIVEQTTHLIDVCRLLIGEPRTVSAEGSRTNSAAHADSDICDVSVATMTFASGAIATLASTCLLGWRHRAELHLFGEGLAIELSDQTIMVDVGAGRPVVPAVDDPVVREDRDFVDAVLGRSNQIRVPFAEALRTHRVATLAAESARDHCLLVVEHCGSVRAG